MLRVMRNHRRAAYGDADGYDGAPRRTRCRSTPPPARTSAWSRTPAGRLGPRGHARRDRTATATRRRRVIAPTGTIGLVMDCDTTGIEPDFALVKFKKLAGGGYFKIINRAVPEALRVARLRRGRDRRRSSTTPSATARSRARPAINHDTLKAKGFTDEKIAARRGRPRLRLRHQVRLQQVDARRGLPEVARLHRRRARRSRPSTS